MQPVDFGTFFRYWLKLGFVSFGGPAGQIALMHQELVEQRRWISEKRFLHALNYCMLLPGPEAQQLAIYIGWLMYRTWGGIVAGTLFVLPSFMILVLLSWLYIAYGHLSALAGFLYGIKPAVTALVLFAAWRIGRRTLHNAWLFAIAGMAFLGIFLVGVPFPAIIAVAALLGWIGGKANPGMFATATGHPQVIQSHAPALIDDDTPTPPHAHFSKRKWIAVLGCGLSVWLITMAALTLLDGWAGTLTQMGWFFTKAALMTFGGAYAVLPYVYQAAVEHYHWLTAPQMIDGLALGETTPGPLIMVVTFVGFIGGWTQALWGPDAQFMAGLCAASVVTFFTFLPSFVLILLGGPFVESTHGNLSFTAPLTAVTAAIVGVILNLATFFAYHVLWPAGLDGRFELGACLIGLTAAIALFRFKMNAIPVILGCGVLGMLYGWLAI